MPATIVEDQTPRNSRSTKEVSITYATVADGSKEDTSNNSVNIGRGKAGNNAGKEEEDSLSQAPSLLDDVPRTPKRPNTRFLDPAK
jgi:hypothetical protein